MLLVFPSQVFAQMSIVDYGLCRVEGQPMEGDSPDGVLSAGDISIIEKTNTIIATKGTCFGVQFTAPIENSDNLGLEARIHHPPIKLKNGQVKESTELPLFIFTDDISFVGWRFNSPNELVAGDWVIEFTNDSKVLARQRFLVQTTSMSAEPKSAPPRSVFVFTGEWETVTRYLVQVAVHSKHDNMIAFEKKLKGMGLSPFSFVEPCSCPHKNLYLTFVHISNSREAAAEHARSVTESYGIDALVKPMRTVVPAGWQQN